MQQRITWDGVINSYIPGNEWISRVPDCVLLHTEALAKLDPITYEVLRYALWTVNDEHGSTIVKASGMPTTVLTHDLNTNLMTEDGEVVFFGANLQFLCGASELAVKWTIENLGKNPGIGEGDIFVTNDPWIGTSHQSDQVFFAPVFWEGKIFCWVASSIHFIDVGGTRPGSCCVDAPDVFSESQPWPPVKIVEGGVLRRDIEGLFRRRSRTPDLIALDLRSAVSGCVVAVERIRGMVERYGPETVKATMRKVIGDSEAAFVSRLRLIPDGHWRTDVYFEAAHSGDRHTYKTGLGITKEGDTLILDNEGSDPQVSAMNLTFAAWLGAILSAVTTIFCFDQLFSIGGPLRHLRFRLTPGTLSCAQHPAAVSLATTFSSVLNDVVLSLLGRMVYSNEQLRSEVFATGAIGSTLPSLIGQDSRGNLVPWSEVALLAMTGGLGALSFKDGGSSGGFSFDPKYTTPNVEDVEALSPVMILYRREETDSGGPGKFRGGLGTALAFILHGVPSAFLNVIEFGAAFSLPSSAGLFGGYPARNSTHRRLRRSNILDWFKSGKMPGTIDELQGTEDALVVRETMVPVKHGDVIEVKPCGAGGYGDPLERDPSFVARDVECLHVSREEAERVYGVVLNPQTDKVDHEATSNLRHHLLRERLERGKAMRVN